MKIGIAGLGRMGSAIAVRLTGLGQDLVVWNRSAGKSAALEAAGAKVAATPARLAVDADVIITILTDANAVSAVYLGKDGLLASGGANVLKVRGASIAAALGGQEISPVTFDVGLIRKDLQTMVEEAQSLGRVLPLAARTLQYFEQAEREGMGAQDGAMVPVRWARQGGFKGEG